VEAFVPELAEALEVDVGVLERCRVDGARPPLRVLAAHDQSRVLEDLEVSRDGGLAHSERLGQLTDRADAGAELLEHGAARRIGQRAEDEAERVRLLRFSTFGVYSHIAIYEPCLMRSSHRSRRGQTPGVRHLGSDTWGQTPGVRHLGSDTWGQTPTIKGVRFLEKGYGLVPSFKESDPLGPTSVRQGVRALGFALGV